MRSDYLIAGILLAVLGFVQLWANGRWPFRPLPEETEASIAAHEPEVGQDEQESGAKSTDGGPWRSWTKVAGYVAVALGVAAIVLSAVRG